MNLSELARRFHFLSNLEALPEADRHILQRVLAEELHRREQKRLAYLMKCSGIKRVKLLTDFDWGFNPKLPREQFLQFVNLIPSQWGKIFDATTASAILDRLSHNGTSLTLEGRSYRSRK